MASAQINDVVGWLAYARHAVMLTGAGISTESGIPDFRGPQGVWTRDPKAGVMAIGALRYGYVATSLFVAALRTPLPYRYSGKVIAVAQAVALLAALTFRLTHGEHWVSTALLLVALASLCWSFGRDVIWQLRHSS